MLSHDFTTVATATAKVVTNRNAKGQFQAGYVGTMIRHAEERQRQRAQVASDIDHQVWLAEHGLDGISPDEIFAA